MPEVEYFRLGLGYDSTCGDYKILKINSASTQILALKDGRWRNIDKHPPSPRSLLFDTPSLPAVHEAFHCIVAVGNYDVVRGRKISLVSFSVSNEMYGEIPLPEQVLCPTRTILSIYTKKLQLFLKRMHVFLFLKIERLVRRI